MSNERYPLNQIILDDFFSHNKVAVLLLIATIISALLTIWITHQTRLQTSQQGVLLQQIQELDNAFLHLQVTENTLGYKKNIEDLSKQLGLQPLKKEQEVILVEE
ncbi:Cell division protein FtsL [Bibersteinia trehalosi USDA-ARS-USMARC-188]|nr:cell division protein FtsL [Bibersteinia trehalosi]AHG82375.1 Cell division protein FtsL [Bibersteinia trehalosi USDA-ARS-USMARC-188]AHG85810.1 Cell division protein FtsL [Bibersteinia trehalosi USDA-ARS-USMARC-190]TCT15257.1 cell division protein FtsL [Bibersteinia trehalosi]